LEKIISCISTSCCSERFTSLLLEINGTDFNEPGNFAFINMTSDIIVTQKVRSVEDFFDEERFDQAEATTKFVPK
jgi:hypothetical protein